MRQKLKARIHAAASVNLADPSPDQDVVNRVLAEIDEWRHGKLWGTVEIATFCGVSPDTIARWARLPDCPISKPNGRYFVTRGAMMDWLRAKKCG